MALSADQIYALARGAGLGPGRAVIATAISGYQGSPSNCESGGNPQAHNPIPPDDSWGIWQINMIGPLGPSRRAALGISSNEELKNPQVNARAMALISSRGLNFSPWTTYVDGCYRANISGAQAAAARVEKNPSLIQQILKDINPVGTVAGIKPPGIPSIPNPLAIATSFYKWLPGGPPPDPDEVKAAQHGLLRVAEVLGGIILIVIALNVILSPVALPVAKAATKVGAVVA